MKQKQLMEKLNLWYDEIPALTEFLQKNNIPFSLTFMGDLVLDDADAQKAIDLYRQYQEEQKSLKQDEATPQEESLSPFALAHNNESSYSAASGNDLPYVVYQVTLKEKFFGTGSGNLVELEDVINQFYRKGYRLHTMSTSNGNSTGVFGGDRIQATLVFEKINLFK